MMNAWVIFGLSLSLAVALVLQILACRPLPGGSPRRCARAERRASPLPPAPLRTQACALYHNWWPLLTGVVYVLAPMPVLFLSGGGGADSYSLLGGDDGWTDVAKFASGARRRRRRGAARGHPPTGLTRHHTLRGRGAPPPRAGARLARFSRHPRPRLPSHNT